MDSARRFDPRLRGLIAFLVLVIDGARLELAVRSLRVAGLDNAGLRAPIRDSGARRVEHRHVEVVRRLVADVLTAEPVALSLARLIGSHGLDVVYRLDDAVSVIEVDQLHARYDHAFRVAGRDATRSWREAGLLGDTAETETAAALSHFTTNHRQGIVHREMVRIVSSFLELWYR